MLGSSNKIVDKDGPASLAVTAGSAWYSNALEVLNPLRWHLNELTNAMEDHNRYAKRLGHPLLPEAKIAAAKEANANVDSFFSPTSKLGHATNEHRIQN